MPRAMMSFVPPGANGTMRRSGLAGKLCAWPAPANPVMTSTTASCAILRIVTPRPSISARSDSRIPGGSALQLEPPPRRVSRLVGDQLHGRDGNGVAGLLDVYQLGGRIPVALRFAGDLHAGNPLEPWADPDEVPRLVQQLGEKPGIGVLLAVLQVHALHQRVEAAPGVQRSQHALQEHRQVVRVREPAKYVRDDAELPQLHRRVIPQPLAVEIGDPAAVERCRLLPPLVGPAILDGDPDCPCLA